MAEFLTANAISFYIEKIIQEAHEELYILFPYLQLSREFYEALQQASERGVQIIIVYTNEDLHTEEKIKLGEIVKLEIYKSENLNSRCCCNEGNLLISSMDLHLFTPSENIEMGVILNKNIDSEQFKNASNEIKAVINSSKNMNLHKKAVEELAQPVIKTKKIYHGFCIVCNMPISYNPDKPYCRSCSLKVNASEIKNHQKYYCHICGQASTSGRNSILCDMCSLIER